MVVRIVIAGEAQCHSFTQACMVANYLSQNLPDLCFERIQKSVVDWEGWLYKMNTKNGWHHTHSPLIWKEVYLKGSKPYYIGGTSQLLEYCHSYYKSDVMCTFETSDSLMKNIYQLEKKNSLQNLTFKIQKRDFETNLKEDLCICISGAGFLLSTTIISGLLDLQDGERNISKIIIFDDRCPICYLEHLEKECSYITTNATKVVKYEDKLGPAITNIDLLIVLDHVPFRPEYSIGGWLEENRKLMKNLAIKLNATAAIDTRILFANLGPACYNATVLSKLLHINPNNIVVATSGLGLQVVPIIAEIGGIPVNNLYCPPVWGFVGINHLVDVKNCMHKYNSFCPYERYTKIKNTTLCAGSLTPELRTMEHLLYFDDTLWTRVAEIKKKVSVGKRSLNESQAVVNVVKQWLFESNSNDILSLGVKCDGSFGLTFDGIFSQPARYVDGIWKPASDYLLPNDPQMKLKYLEEMAQFTMGLKKDDLPIVNSYNVCICIQNADSDRLMTV